MKTLRLSELKHYKIIESLSDDLRKTKIFNFSNVTFLKNKIYYPECIIKSGNTHIDIIDEKIMSLDFEKENLESELNDNLCIENTPLFYFVYNTENYYHFIYDTLPYLISFFYLKSSLRDLKLLVNYPNRSSSDLFKFVKEILEKLDIYEDDLVFINDKTNYSNLYVSSSFTHGLDSNLPISNHGKKIFQMISEKTILDIETPKKIYISRRSWVHNDFSNIGTNYTQRRKLVSEDKIVDILQNNGFKEVFPELMSLDEKINLFKNATHIVGPIGGGLVNCLFSTNKTSLLVISSPLFLDINYRFIHSFDNVKTKIITDTFHVEKGLFKKYMRVRSKSKNIIGEIVNVENNQVKILYSQYSISGWNEKNDYLEEIINFDDCEILDYGLNSEFDVDLDSFERQLITFLN